MILRHFTHSPILTACCITCRIWNYHWRLWTIPEATELLLAAGFDAVHVWLRPMRQTAPQTPQSSGRRGGRQAQVRLRLTNLILMLGRSCRRHLAMPAAPVAHMEPDGRLGLQEGMCSHSAACRSVHNDAVVLVQRRPALHTSVSGDCLKFTFHFDLHPQADDGEEDEEEAEFREVTAKRPLTPAELLKINRGWTAYLVAVVVPKAGS